MKILKLLENKVTINWDRNSKIGGVPDQSNLDYMGFERYMTGREFRNLVPPGVWNEKTKQFAMDRMLSGGDIAPPFLLVEWDKERGVWVVQNHEGRSRVDAAIELGADENIPVSMLPRNEMRARHVTDEMRKAPIVGQIGSPSARES